MPVPSVSWSVSAAASLTNLQTWVENVSVRGARNQCIVRQFNYMILTGLYYQIKKRSSSRRIGAKARDVSS